MGASTGTWDHLAGMRRQSENHIRSVAISLEGLIPAITAFQSNAFALISVKDGILLQEKVLKGVCGMASARHGFAAGSDQFFAGALNDSSQGAAHSLSFDNRMVSFDFAALKGL